MLNITRTYSMHTDLCYHSQETHNSANASFSVTLTLDSAATVAK